MAYILVVEDDDSLRELVVDTAKRLGHRTHAVSSAEEAWELLDQGQWFTLIISDNDMGEMKMSGVELLERVRDDSDLIGIKFALMSGREELPDGRRLEDICRKHGATFMLKGKIKLLEMIPRLLE